MSRRARHRLCALALAFGLSLGARAAGAQYRLQGNVYAFGSSPSPAGMLSLSGQAKPTSWADAEAAVWLGTGAMYGGDQVTGDVMVANVRLREPHGYGELRLGRMLVATGAVRPLQIDGASLLGRVPYGGPTVQVFGGVPVQPQFGAKAYDWAAGGRVAQRYRELAQLGVSYLQRRGEGRIAFEELGFDASVSPVRWLDAAAVVAVDLLHPSVSDARASVALRFGPGRFELFALRRSPAHLLPATSLFAAIGDVPSDQAGASISVRAAPRLDVWATGSVDSLGGQLGGRQSLHATLRLDDRGDGAVGFEMRRQWAPYGASWTGGRGTARVPIVYGFRVAAELEVVVPDEPAGRGSAWPWGLLSLAYSPTSARWLEMAGGVEAGASPTRLYSVAGIFRLSATWERQR
jgi:hypothetical protein